jgi:hypothetical protein
MKRVELTILFLVGLNTIVVPQTSYRGQKSLPTQISDLEMRAVISLRKFALAESIYAVHHSQEGFACDPQVLTKLEWPSPNHVKLVDPALLSGAGQYRFSAHCEDTSKPFGKLNILAVPLDPNANLRTFCATGAFGPLEEKPYFGTTEFPIRSISGGNPESCLASGKLLK